MKGKSIYYIYMFLNIFLALIFFIHLGGLKSWAFYPIVLGDSCNPIITRSVTDPNIMIPTRVNSIEVIEILFFGPYTMDPITTSDAFHFYAGEDESTDLKENGNLVIDGWILTYTPHISLEACMSYTVKIDSSATDTEGSPLDCNYNGVGGEGAVDDCVMKFVIDSIGNCPPILASIGNRTIDEGDFYQFTITATDPDGDELIYTTDNLPSGASFDPNTQKFKWKPNYSQAGSYEVTFTVADNSAPPLSASETITITVINKRRPSSNDSYYGYGWNYGWYSQGYLNWDLTNYQQQVWNNQLLSNWNQPTLQQWPTLSQTWQQQTWNQPFNLQSYTPPTPQLQPWFKQQYQQWDFTGYLQQREGLWNWPTNQSDFTGYQHQVFDFQKQQQLLNLQQKPWNQYNYLNIWQ